MKWYPGPDGGQRLWFEPGEIETICDEELKKAGLIPTDAAPVTDLERVIEQYLGADLDQYADLEPHVLGFTAFPEHKVPAVSINKDLTGSALDEEETVPGLKGRWRATLAHEASHIILHRFLFDVHLDQGQLFTMSSEEPQRKVMRCLKRDVGYGRSVSDWREVQANQGMAALLMPRRLFKKAARAIRSASGIGTPTVSSSAAVLLAQRLAETFAVSRQAAAIRLETLQLVRPEGASALGL